jgi:flagellar hook protein FlgE
MGIYGALSTAVTGLRAQSYALENISGNIANSQTTGFKRLDTDFVDLIPDATGKNQTAGSVLSQSRATNNLQGDTTGSTTATHMAINGNGFFVVEPAIGQADGAAVFSGGSFYTRRGDFELDKNGYLVNGAGYYLKGLPIDPATKNISGSVPQVLQISNSFLAAQETTRINYQINLPQLPKTPNYNQSLAVGSELLNPKSFLEPDEAALLEGGTFTGGANSAGTIPTGALTITVGGAPTTFTLNSGGSDTLPEIDLDQYTVTQLLARISGELPGGASLSLDGDGTLRVMGGNLDDSISVSGNVASGLGLVSNTVANPTVSDAVAGSTPVNQIAAKDVDDFFAQSISGGAITVYAGNGAPANVQMRWAKVSSASDNETWKLFLFTDANATGEAPAWTSYGGNYVFGADGSPKPPVEYTDLQGLTINGVVIGDVRLQHGAKGLTQFADPNGVAEVTTLSQNGYAAGEYVSVAVNDAGRIVVSYNNGQQIEYAQVVTANFNAVNQLKRMDGGVFAATSDSGEPILDHGGGIIGSSLEASNTDISEEFTKLIITQQAYAAGTRIVSTADQMLQEALNMLR